ncbi:MAG TPA: hypothetical protein VFQ53_31730 [Kofleriaceae bacterium]|nr:hypothetical protein [Kofleriaceae bacterium]
MTSLPDFARLQRASFGYAEGCRTTPLQVMSQDSSHDEDLAALICEANELVAILTASIKTARHVVRRWIAHVPLDARRTAERPFINGE